MKMEAGGWKLLVADLNTLSILASVFTIIFF